MIVGNTMVISVRERTREIGVLKTLGFSGAFDLAYWCSGELLLLALLGGIPGLGLAVIACYLVRDTLANFVPGIAVTPGIALLGLLFMVVLGLLTGAVPALGAMRMKIATALGRS